MLNTISSLIATTTTTTNTVSTTFTNPIDVFGSNSTLVDLFGLFTNVVVGVGIALTVIFLGMAGILYVTSRGDKTQTESARNALTNAIIGLVIVLAALAIRWIVGNVFGNSGAIDNVSPF